MTVPAGSNSTSAPRSPPPAVRWRVWPLSEGGPDNALVIVCIAVVGAVVGLVTREVLWALTALLLMSAAAWRLFVPVIYEVNALGVFQEIFGRRQRISWRAIETFELGQGGVFLTMAGPLPAFRGLYLPWQEHRQEVLALLDYYLVQVRHEDRAADFELRA